MGFLIAGVLIGPNGLQWIIDSQSVDKLAEIGVVLLLFVIGLEFSLGSLLKNVATVVGCGGLQLAFTALATILATIQFDIPKNSAIVIGLLAALSSTAIVLKMLTDRAEINSLHGKICIGILLFQDLCVVPIMIAIPLLGQSGDYSAIVLGLAMLKSLVAVASIFLFSRLLVPRTLEFIARTGSKEHLTLFVILIILGTGWLSQTVGLSLAMGAFIAGMILSESEYNHQIIVDILPLKDYFGSIFFISMGMLLQVEKFFTSSWWYLGVAGVLIVGKAVLAFLAALLMRTPIRIAFVIGLMLAQIGEFSLLMAHLALDHGLFSGEQYQSFLILSILTMLAAPVLIQFSSVISIKLFSGFPAEPDRKMPVKRSLSDHVIVAGYGLIGRNLARVLREISINFLVLELNGERIKQALTEKMNVLYGDVTNRDILLRAGIKQAKMIVFAVSDYVASMQGVQLARQINPAIYILVRTRLASQVEEFNAAGANQVIPEEFETSIEIFSRVLKEYHIPNNIIEQQIELTRLEGYGMFRGISLSMDSLKKFSTFLAASLTESFHILENSWAKGKTLQDLQLQPRTGSRLIAVVRGNEVHANPNDNFAFTVGDVLILFGRHAQLDQTANLLKNGPTQS